MAYTTVDKFKDFRGIEGTSDDAIIQAFIDATQATIDLYVGFPFEGGAADRVFDSSRDTEGLTLWVEDVGPLASITSITNGDGTAVTTGQYKTVPLNAAARSVPIRGIKLLGSADIAWEAESDGDTEGAITVKGIWAWSATAPANIVEVCNLGVADMYDRRLSSDGDLVIVPGTSVRLSRHVWSAMMPILEFYRRRC